MSEIKKGTTARTEYFRLVTTSGTALLGAAITSMMLSYTRDRSVPVNSLMTALGSESSPHAGFKAFEIYSGYAIASNWAPGLYRVDAPDSAFITGADKVVLAVTHPLADPAMKELALVDNIESDTFTVATSNATGIGSLQTGVNSIYGRIGAPIGASLAADVGSIQVGVNSISVQVGSNAIAISSLHTRVGSVQTGADNIFARIGAPVGASLAVDVSSIQAGVSSLQPLLVSVSSVQTGVNSSAVQVGSNAVAIASLHSRVSSVQTQADNIFTRIGAPVGASISVDISSVQAGVAALTTNVGSVQTGVNSAAVQVGSNAVSISSLHTRVASVQTQADNIFTRIGAPTGASLAVDVSSIQAGVNSLQPLLSNVGSVQTGVNSLLTTVGSLHTRVSSVQTGADNIFARIGAPAGASVSVDVASIQTGVTALSAGVNITRVDSDANAAFNLRRGTLATVTGGTTGDSTTDTLSTVNVTPAAAVAHQWTGRVLMFDRDTLTSALRGQATVINSMTAGGVLSVASLTTAPISGNTFVIT